MWRDQKMGMMPIAPRSSRPQIQLATFVVALLLSASVAKAQSPREVVGQAVRAASSINPPDAEIRKTYFSQNLQDLFAKLSRIKECNFWDGNVINGAQEQDGLKVVEMAEIANTGRLSIVRAVLQGSYQADVHPRAISRFLLLLENGRWKIDEIILSEEAARDKGTNPFQGTMHSYLRALLSRNCR